MKRSKVDLRCLHAVGSGNPRRVLIMTAAKSTVAKSSSPFGKRPTPTADQVKKIQQIGRELVDATVARQKEHAMKAWEKASLEERRKIMDSEIQDLSRPSKPKSLERLEFEALRTDGDYVTVTPSVPTIDDSNRPKPGAFVELRR
jgi:hypothetical protein